MYPVIPHPLLKSPTDTSSSSTKSLLGLSSKQVKSSTYRTTSATLTTKHSESITKITAITDIPRGTCSEDISVADFREEKLSAGHNISVCVSEESKLKVVGGDKRWMLDARLADDCHSYNIILQSGGTSNTVLLQVVRAIGNGEELQLWFSEQMLAALAVPFLTPLNIQGEKRYVCHRCGRHFEIPNPLKMHLSLDCDRLSRSHLWKRLCRHLASKQEDSSREQRRLVSASVQNISSLAHTSNNTSPTFGFKFELVPKDDRKKYQFAQDLSTASNTATSSSVSKNEDLQIAPNLSVRHSTRPISEPLNVRSSAFKPYWSRRTNSSITESTRTNVENESSTPLNILPNLRPSIFPQPRFLFQSTSQHSGTHLQMSKSSTVSGLLNTNSLLVPRGYNKQSPLLPSAFQQPTETTSTEFPHAAEMETLVSNLGRSKQGHLCIYCGKIYSRKYGLKIHIRTHTGYKPLKCKFCHRPFGDPSNLNKHVRLHAEGDTPYKCDLCGKILVRRRDLERHIKSRHSPHLDTEQDQETNKNPNS